MTFLNMPDVTKNNKSIFSMKTTKFLTLLIFSLTLLTFSCNGSDDTTIEEEVSLEIIAGSWSGTFEGDDSGTYTVVVNANGTVTGTAFSNDLQQTLGLNGTMDNAGNFDAVAGSAANGATFTGKFRATTSSGTWNNPTFNESGTWQGTKDE